jgi:hypothetical protein
MSDADDICNHERAGIVTNQPDGYDRKRAHAAVSVCGSPTCRARAFAWVWEVTKEQGHYISDSSRKPKP